MLAQLGDAYASVLSGDEAIDCYRRSVAVEDRAEVRAALVVELLNQGSTDAAAAELDR